MGRVDFNEAWLDVQGLINSGYTSFPRHQGTTDVTEVVEFARIADEHNLSDAEYNRLIDRGQHYLNDLYSGKTPAQLEKKYQLTASARYTDAQKRKSTKKSKPKSRRKSGTSPTSLGRMR